MTFDPGPSPFRLRVGLANPIGSVGGEFKLYAKKNSSNYAPITASSTDGIQSYDASSSADNTAILIPRLTLGPSPWQLTGAAIDLDFAGNRVYPSGAFTDYLSCSRASDGYAKNSAGEWVQFSSNVLRITDLGLTVEATRTNYLLNSATPATQTTGSLDTGSYALWVEGTGSALASAGTATITGAASATEGSPNIFTVTVSGTVVVTVTGSLDLFQLEQGGFPSSYILTTSSSAVRATDIIDTIGAAQSIFNSTAGTLVVDMKLNTVTPYIQGSRKYIGDATEYTQLYNNGGTAQSLWCQKNGGTQQQLEFDATGQTYEAGVKLGCSWDATPARSLSAGGSAADTDVLTMGWPQLRIGNVPSGNEGTCANFRRLTGWTSRLSDAALQGFTAP